MSVSTTAARKARATTKANASSVSSLMADVVFGDPNGVCIVCTSSTKDGQRVNGSAALPYLKGKDKFSVKGSTLVIADLWIEHGEQIRVTLDTMDKSANLGAYRPDAEKPDASKSDDLAKLKAEIAELKALKAERDALMEEATA